MLRRLVFDMILHVTSLIGRGELFSTRPVVGPPYPRLTPSACRRRSEFSPDLGFGELLGQEPVALLVPLDLARDLLPQVA